ncbi:two-component system OmpR family sensor kinase/two-component system sensor histidine kinase QseC [Limnobacter thiooxidans]|nr:two-component system OmpR family sensor kinase/two-component system sensor histidine kinase QseC [Limnobacter thiooxidans]
MNRVLQAGWSLRQRLTVMLFSLVLMLWGLSAAVIYFQAEKESQELFDMAISETASLLLFISEHELLEVGNADVAGQDYVESPVHKQYLSFQLWDSEGNLRYRSANAPRTPLAPLDVEGFGWQNTDGEITRTFNLLDRNKILRIIVAEPLTHRQEISAHFFLGLLLFSVILLPLGYLGVRLIVTKAFGPVKRCVDQVDTLDTKNLNRVEIDDVPLEIEPLLQALNSAIERIQAGVAREKRFTADAAHELRTPLAGVKANIQLLQKLTAPQQAMESEVMVDTLEGVDRCSRMINQLLALSKSDGMAARSAPMEKLDIQNTVIDVFSLERAHAEFRKVSLSFNDSSADQQNCSLASVLLKGYPTAIELLIRNLVNNAITYNVPGGEVQVTVACLSTAVDPEKARVRISVMDNGPGIPADQRALIFNRFFRARPNQTKGSGLGLSICKEVAELHGTSIVVCEGIGGQGVGFAFELEGVWTEPSTANMKSPI